MTRTKAIVGALAGLFVVLGGLAWWLGYFTDPPEEATIEAAAEAVSAEGDAVATVTDGAAAEGIAGLWAVEPNEEVTFVGYRINEVLTTIGDFEVVGRTPDVTGTMEADGTVITDVSLTARMDTLTTDNDRRDSAMRSQALETSEFPEATFALTSPIELGSIPAEGETISVTATGDLTIHGVTNSVDFPLDAQIVADSVVVVGQLEVQLAEFDINPPSSPIVASVEDVAILELSVAFGR